MKASHRRALTRATDGGDGAFRLDHVDTFLAPSLRRAGYLTGWLLTPAGEDAKRQAEADTLDLWQQSAQPER